MDSYRAIAEKIIDESEIGLRLHAALEGEAADFLEDVPVQAFGQIGRMTRAAQGVAGEVDETRMSKVGSAI